MDLVNTPAYKHGEQNSTLKYTKVLDNRDIVWWYIVHVQSGNIKMI